VSNTITQREFADWLLLIGEEEAKTYYSADALDQSSSIYNPAHED
ncbi:7839_t:CDS:2, partial [Racocetra persica]